MLSNLGQAKNFIIQTCVQKKSILFKITMKCNFKCVHCFDSCNIDEETMTQEQVDKCCDLLLKMPDTNQQGCAFEAVLHGGEPMLYPEYCIQIAQQQRKRNFTLAMLTNGYWWNNEELIKTIENDIAPDCIYLSTDIWHSEFLSLYKVEKIFKRFKNNPKITVYPVNVSFDSKTFNYGSELFKKYNCSPVQLPLRPMGRALEYLGFKEELNKDADICSSCGIAIYPNNIIRGACGAEGKACIINNLNDINNFESLFDFKKFDHHCKRPLNIHKEKKLAKELRELREWL